MPSSHLIHRYLNFKCKSCQQAFGWFCCCPVDKSGPILGDTMDSSTLGFPVLHYLLESIQTHVSCVSDAIQSSHTLSSPSPPALNLSQPVSGSFPMSWLIPSGGQSIGASAPTSMCTCIYSKYTTKYTPSILQKAL